MSRAFNKLFKYCKEAYDPHNRFLFQMGMIDALKMKGLSQEAIDDVERSSEKLIIKFLPSNDSSFDFVKMSDEVEMKIAKSFKVDKL